MHNHFIDKEAVIETQEHFGKNIIRVCRGTICHVKNSAKILHAIETELGIEPGDSTRDKNFTLEIISCIGACSIAPVININEDFYGRIDDNDIPNILDRYRTDANETNDLTFRVEQKINTN